MKRWKRWTGVFLSLALLSAYVPETRAYAETPVSTEAQEGTESIFEIYVGNGQSIPQYQAGQSIEKLTVRVVNKGDSDLKNVKIMPNIEDTADWPFVMEGTRHGYYLDKIKAGEYAEATWKALQVREDVETKIYKLSYHITWQDDKEEYECDRYIEVKTAEKNCGEPQNPSEEPQPDPGQDTQGDADAGGFYSGDISAVGGGAEEKRSSACYCDRI